MDAVCRNNEWVGSGRYAWDGRKLSLEFSALARRGALLKEPPTVEADVEGHGNTIVVRPSGVSQSYTWSRAMGGN